MEHENKMSSWTAQIRKLKEKRSNFIIQVERLMKDITEINKKVKGLNVKVQNYNKSDFHLSDHFILRFRERIRDDLTIPEMKQLIFTERTNNLFRILGNGEYPILIGDIEHKVIMKNKILVTII